MRDVLGDLAAGQLTTFTRFRALSHLDLQHLRAREILRRHAEASRSDLLDLRFQGIAGLQLDVGLDSAAAETRGERLARLYRSIAVAVFAAFTCVRFPSDAVHRNGERGVRFSRNRAERHRAGGKS